MDTLLFRIIIGSIIGFVIGKILAKHGVANIIKIVIISAFVILNALLLMDSFLDKDYKRGFFVIVLCIITVVTTIFYSKYIKKFIE